MQEQIGQRIRMVREKVGMKQSEFASAIGTAQSRLSKWERGEARAPRWAIRVIAESFLVSEEWLLQGGSRNRMMRRQKYRPPEVSREFCGGCLHYIAKGEYSHCNYLIDTGKRRLCKPGKGCTEHT